MVDLAGSPLRPRWIYDDGAVVDYLMSTPQRPWDFGSRGVGGSDTSAAGVPAAYEIRRDYLLHLTLRFPESEWDDVARLVRHLQRAGSATFYPDQDDPSISHTVYGDSPRIGEEIRPRRSDFLSVLELDITVRRTTASIFTDLYMGDLLFHWQAGTRADGMVFTRSGTAYYVGRAGVLQIAATNVERTEWTGPGFGTPTLLLEDARTNGWTRSEELNDGVWTKTRASISADAVSAPDGATTADKIVEDSTASATHLVRRDTPTLANDTDQPVSCFVKAGERIFLRFVTVSKAGTSTSSWFNLTTGAWGTTSHTTVRATALADGWHRIEVVFDSESGGTTPRVEFQLALADATGGYNGDGSSGLYLWGVQFEADQPFASSYIQTVGSTVTRNTEALYFDFSYDPREMTLYLKFIERGSILTGTSTRLAQIGAADDSSPQLSLYNSSDNYALFHNSGAGAGQSTLGAAPNFGDPTEVRGVLDGDGQVLIGQSVSGTAETLGALTAAGSLAGGWSDQRFYINSIGATRPGFNAFRAIKVARGTKTMEQMRVMSS